MSVRRLNLVKILSKDKAKFVQKVHQESKKLISAALGIKNVMKI